MIELFYTDIKRRGFAIFNLGDRVVHPKYGAGILTEERTIMRNGEEKIYLCVDLNDDFGSFALIPKDRLETCGLRPALDDIDIVDEIMGSEPQVLEEHHRARKAQLEEMLKSNKPRQLIRALRDLAWREHTEHLTNTDRQFMKKIRRKLHRELSVDPKMTVDGVRQKINSILSQAIRHHANATSQATG